MTVKEYQEQVDHWIKTTGVRYFDQLTNMAMLTEEVGEVSRIIAREYGEQSYKPGAERPNLADELADVLFVVTCLANQCDIDLEKALQRNIEKKTQRDAERHQQNEKLKDR